MIFSRPPNHQPQQGRPHEASEHVQPDCGEELEKQKVVSDSLWSEGQSSQETGKV